MEERHSLAEVHKLGSRNIFFDANVIIYVFWPSGLYRREELYSQAFNRLLKMGNVLMLDFIVVSEVVNTIMRIEYDKFIRNNSLDKKTVPFKSYRESNDGIDTLSDIHIILRENILNRFTIIGKAFTAKEIEEMLMADSLAINDKAIATICKENRCILLTNDKDFLNAGIELLTSNPLLLKH